VKACLPDPLSLASGYTGKTCIGCLIKGVKSKRTKELFIFNVCDHEECYNEVESQAISYTAGVPPVAAALLIANGAWDVGKMVNGRNSIRIRSLKILKGSDCRWRPRRPQAGWKSGSPDVRSC